MAVVNDDLITKLDLIGLSAYTSGLGRAADAMGLMDAATTASQRRMLAYGVAAGAAAAGIAAGLARTITEAGKMQQAEIAFTTLLGSADAAAAKLKELQDFSDLTPFNFEEALHGSRMLLGMGVSAEQVIPIMNALGNAISATGGSSEHFGRALYAVSRIISTGKLQGDELNQLAEAGVPLADMYRELGIQAGQAGNANISAERALAALIKVMSQGRFAGAMSDQMKTLNGSASTLADSAQRLEAAIGKGLIGPATTAVQAATRLIDTLNAMPASAKAMIGVVGVGAVGALAAYSAATLLAIRRTIQLAEAHLRAAGAAGTHAIAETGATLAMGGPASMGMPPPGSPRTPGPNRGPRQPGRFGRIGRGGAAAMAAAIGGEIALGYLPDSIGKRIGQGALAGAGLGATLGSIVPGLGTAAGAGIGAVAGGLLGGLSGSPAQAAAKSQDPAAMALEKQNEILRQQLAELRGIRQERTPLDTRDMAAAYQWWALRGARALA